MEIDLTIARPVVSTSWKIHRADSDNYITSYITPSGRTNVRRLTALECERLQTLPDNYTAGEKFKDRIIAIGNGWTVDAIAWILKGLPSEHKKYKHLCFNCQKDLVEWISTEDLIDYAPEYEGVVNNFVCSNCGAEITYVIKDKDNDL